jgi:hypothetical protein
VGQELYQILTEQPGKVTADRRHCLDATRPGTKRNKAASTLGFFEWAYIKNGDQTAAALDYVRYWQCRKALLQNPGAEVKDTSSKGGCLSSVKKKRFRAFTNAGFISMSSTPAHQAALSFSSSNRTRHDNPPCRTTKPTRCPTKILAGAALGFTTRSRLLCLPFCCHWSFGAWPTISKYGLSFNGSVLGPG